MSTYFKLFSQPAESNTILDDDEDGETPFEDKEGNIPSELQLLSTKKEDSPQLKRYGNTSALLKDSTSQYGRHHNNFNTLKSITDLIQQPRLWSCNPVFQTKLTKFISTNIFCIPTSRMIRVGLLYLGQLREFLLQDFLSSQHSWSNQPTHLSGIVPAIKCPISKLISDNLRHNTPLQ